MKLGIYGGSFDPVHYGHLLLAERCREALALDEVWFVPAHQPPHKLGRRLSAPEHRCQMLELATAGNAAFRVSTIELDRAGTSYTVDSLEQIDRDHPDWELTLLMGADTLRDLPNWREPTRVRQLAKLAVVHRGGHPPASTEDSAAIAPPDAGQFDAPDLVEMPLIEISGSDLRHRVAEGLSIRYQVPAAVEQYIRQHGLFLA